MKGGQATGEDGGCGGGVQVAHVVDEVEYLRPGSPAMAKGWAAAQVAASADFSHGSFFWTHVSGGLNYQARAPTRMHTCEHIYCASVHQRRVALVGWTHARCFKACHRPLTDATSTKETLQRIFFPCLINQSRARHTAWVFQRLLE